MATQIKEYDVIVVGARVAGAATARLLARRGLRVLLVDRRRPAADTLSTHALMRGGVLQLSRWGLLDRVISAGTPAVGQTVLHYGDVSETVPIKPKAGVPSLFAPRRTVLDPILVEAASEEGVDVRFGVTVTTPLVDATGRVIGVTGRDREGQPFEAFASMTVGADGTRSAIARGVGAEVLRQARHASAMIYSYWSGAPVDGYEWFYRPGVSAGLIPTNGGLTCAWVGVSSTCFTSDMARDLDSTFHCLLAQGAPEALPRFEHAQQEGRFFAFPGLRGFQRQPWGRGWSLVGDASHFKDPLSTHGITDALRDAEFLAEAISACVEGRVDESEAGRSYRTMRDRLSHELFTATDVVASYDWEPAELRHLLLALAASMREEVDVLSRLHTTPVMSAA
jgi:flavin-dependent dehydrogenase